MSVSSDFLLGDSADMGAAGMRGSLSVKRLVSRL